MSDYADLVLPKLQARGSGLIGDGKDILLPSYDGFGLANLTPTISHWLNGPHLGSPLLDPTILSMFGENYKQVVLILVDALGYRQLTSLMASGKARPWQQNLNSSILVPLTSVSPSTTATALTTIWTATHPNTHGFIGYEMWLREYSMVINTILHTPISFQGDVGGLSRTGFDPATFLGVPGVGKCFGEHGIVSHAFLPASILNSGLSQMHLAGSQTHGYVSDSDLWINVRDLLNTRTRKRRFIYAYWHYVDSLAHRYGTYDERVTEQFSDFSDGMQRLFLDQLEGWARKDTLVLLTADHGSITTPYDPRYELDRHPELLSHLVMQPTCENRLAFLYLKPGSEMAVRQYFEQVWPGEFSLITREQALEMHLFGTGPNHPDLANRVGSLIAIPHGDAYLWWVHKKNLMRGRHGGLHPDEMLIPLYSLSLD